MASAELITRKTSLSSNIVAFCRYLRERGFPISPAEEADALRTLTIVPYTDPETFQASLKAVLTRSRIQQRQFDELFATYWRELSKAIDSKIKDGDPEAAENNSPTPPKKDAFQALKSWLYGKPTEEETELAVFSRQEVITYKDFSSFSEAELQEVMKIISLIAKRLASQYNRRYHSTHRHRNLDLKRTLRINLRRGGEMVDIAYKQKQKRRLNMVMLCDVSKSMDLYSRFLIHFMYAFQHVFKRMETFVFSTSLHRITEEFKEQDFSYALRKVAEQVNNWSGGTRIGESLDTFTRIHAPKMVSNRTIVLILSDGWDTGDLGLLEGAMKYLNKRAAKVVWLNPLAGNPNFEPTVAGMQAAMPYIDVFASAHNVASLRKVIKQLGPR